MTATEVSVATSARSDATIATIVTAFAADPFVRYWLPEPQTYLTAFPRIIHAFAGAAFERGTAWCSDDHAAAALWLPPGVAPAGDALLDIARDVMAPDRLAEYLEVGEQMDAAHPTGPHWHLPLIGVDPTHQGRRLGSALLEHSLERCDRERMPAYLEATSPRNVPLYERFGFEPVGCIRAGGSPPLIPMLRAARAGGRS